MASSASNLEMFPAYAGMNRQVGVGESEEENVPRIRGDEPVPSALIDW